MSGATARKRPRRERDALEMIEFARRAINAAARHAASADEFELAEFASLEAEYQAAMRRVVAGQRAVGRSWQYIGDALGIKRHSAFERYAEKTPDLENRSQ